MALYTVCVVSMVMSIINYTVYSHARKRTILPWKKLLWAFPKWQMKESDIIE